MENAEKKEKWIDNGDKLSAVIKWADEQEDFDDSFLLSLKVYFDNRGELTPRQESALENIIDRWHISWEDYLS